MSVKQTGNEVGGDLVGGDKIVVNNFGSTPSSRLLALLQKLKEEMASDTRFEELLPELKRFQEPSNEIKKSIDEKLEDSGRGDLLKAALLAKEAFTKKMVKLTLFETAQEIHALVLSRIYTKFTHEIRPLIAADLSRDHVERRIRDIIIEPIVEELQHPPLRYYDEEVYGMIYFLAGNCHIDWEK